MSTTTRATGYYLAAYSLPDRHGRPVWHLQCLRHLDDISERVLVYFGQRDITKAALIADKPRILAYLNARHPSHHATRLIID
jgi:hypothetical protein